MKSWCLRVMAVSLFWTGSMSAEVPACISSYAFSFFSEPDIDEALSLHMVYQNLWELIKVSLDRKLSDFDKRLEDRAKSLSPNPLESPLDKKKTADVLNEVLFNILKEALSENTFTDFDAARRMFNFLQERHKAEFVACLGSKSYEEIGKEKMIHINLNKDQEKDKE